MKKRFALITVMWLCALILIILVISKDTNNIDGMYKVTINRVHQRLTGDLEKNTQIINGLTKEDLNFVENIEIIDYQNTNFNEIDGFFYDGTTLNETVVFKPIEGTYYIVKYRIVHNDSDNNTRILWLALIVTGVYVYLMFYTFRLHRNIIKPMERISDVTNQMARGYLGETNLQYKNRYFKEFIWGLDMLREQLAYERDKNTELEKQRKTLVASLSHEIKTPLSSVKNYAIALKEDIYENKEDRNKALEIILDKVEDIERLTKELLDTASKEVRNIEVKPKEIYMLEVHNRLNRIIREKTDLLYMDYIESKIGENLLLMVDPDRLQEVFDNVIENALKYGDLNSIKISYDIEENYQLIEIHNTGSPIPKTELKYIFNSYYRGSNTNNKPGHGLGLYISKQIMRNMQGDIFAKNTEKGVSFVVVIKQAG